MARHSKAVRRADLARTHLQVSLRATCWLSGLVSGSTADAENALLAWTTLPSRLVPSRPPRTVATNRAEPANGIGNRFPLGEPANVCAPGLLDHPVTDRWGSGFRSGGR